MSAPFMQLYVADYLGDTRHLTTEQHGAYLLLLMTLWRSDGYLPNDDKKLARIVGCTPSRWARIRGDVLAFFRVDDGRIFSERLNVEIKLANEKQIQRADAGSKGGRAKALNNKKTGLANASVLLFHSPEAINTHPESKDSVCVSHAREDDFDGWWIAYPNATAKPKARAAYALALKSASPEELLSGLERSKASARWADPTYTRPNPATWLAEERWLDDPPINGKPVEAVSHKFDDEFMKTREEMLRRLTTDA